MTPDHFEVTAEVLGSRRPFQPFYIYMFGDQRIEIDHPDALLIVHGLAIYTMPGNRKLYFDYASVSFITEGSPFNSDELR